MCLIFVNHFFEIQYGDSAECELISAIRMQLLPFDFWKFETICFQNTCSQCASQNLDLYVCFQRTKDIKVLVLVALHFSISLGHIIFQSIVKTDILIR